MHVFISIWQKFPLKLISKHYKNNAHKYRPVYGWTIMNHAPLEINYSTILKLWINQPNKKCMERRLTQNDIDQCFVIFVVLLHLNSHIISYETDQYYNDNYSPLMIWLTELVLNYVYWKLWSAFINKLLINYVINYKNQVPQIAVYQVPIPHIKKYVK